MKKLRNVSVKFSWHRRGRTLTCVSSVKKHVLRGRNRSGGWRPCMKVSENFYRNLRPRAPQIRPTWTLPRRAHHMGYHLDCAQNLGFSHRQWAKTRPWSLNTARCRTSGMRAPRIMETVWKRIWDLRAARCRRSARTGDHDDIHETRNTLPHTRSASRGEHIIFWDTRTRDQDDAFGDTRTRDQDDVRDTRTREHSDDRNARSRDLQHRLNERPTHEDDRRNSGDIQQNSYHSGNNSSLSRPSSSPKVPTFDGTNTAQFRPWIIQFEAIERHQGWTAGEQVVRLVSSLTGPAANLLIEMTLGQLDNYNFLRARLSRRYDPPEREEAHRAELRARTRCRNESADEFAENIKNLAQRAYPLADQNMLDNLVVERFREGHGNEELKKHLCLCPSTGLQDLIGACVRFETHVEIGSHARKSNEGLYTVQSWNRNELTLEEVTRAARKLGFGLRPWIVRQQNPRGFSNTAPGRNQNSGEQQQSHKFNQSGNGNARTQNPIRRQTPVGDVKCWTCGKTGHYASDCKSSGPKFAFTPKALKMNFLQQIADQVQEFSEEEQNPRSGNE